MDKKSNENTVCTYCAELALDGTFPPVCTKHQDLQKNATKTPDTLKTLETSKLDW